MATYPVLSAPNPLTTSKDATGDAGSPGPLNGTDDAATTTSTSSTTTEVEATSSSSGGSASTTSAYEVSGLIDGARGMILAARAAYWEVWDVVLDTHIYQCFTRSMRLFSPKEHIYEVGSFDVLRVYALVRVFYGATRRSFHEREEERKNSDCIQAKQCKSYAFINHHLIHICA